MNRMVWIVIGIVLIDGIMKKENLMDLFIEGVQGGLKLIKPLFTTLMAFMVFVELLRSSGMIEVLSYILQPLLIRLQIPVDVMILSILRPISANASLSFLYTLFESFGVDHPISLLGSLIQCGSDTTLYVVTLYFSSLNLKETRYALPIGLLMDCLCVIFALIIYLKVFV